MCHAKIMICGAAKAGKTSFTRFLRNKKFEKEYESTPVGDTRQVLIKQNKKFEKENISTPVDDVLSKHKFNICETGWTDLNEQLQCQEIIQRMLSKLNKQNVESDSESNTEYETDDDNQPPNNSTNKPVNIPANQPVNKSAGNQPANNQTLLNLFNTQSQTEFEVSVSDEHQENISSKKESNTKHETVDSERNMTNIDYVNIPKEILEGQHDKKLEMWDMLTLLDTGGQPELINMLPAINISTTVSFLVFNLSKGDKCLEQLVVAQSSKKGYKRHKKNYTILYLLKCLLSFIKMSARNEIQHPNIKFKKCCHKSSVFFIGTHADKLAKRLLRNEVIKLQKDRNKEEWKYKINTIKEPSIEDEDQGPHELNLLLNNLVELLKNQKVELLNDEDVKSLNLEDIEALNDEDVESIRYALKNSFDNTVNAINKQIKELACEIKPGKKISIWNLSKKNFIAVDNTSSGKPQDENHAANLLREKIFKEVRKTQCEIPIVWFILELQLCQEKEVVISLDQVKLLSDKIMPEGQKIDKPYIRGILKFFHALGTLMYFDEVDGMNDYVITKPQWLFNTLTDLVNCTVDNDDNIMDDTVLSAFKCRGILSDELLDSVKLSIDDKISLNIDTNSDQDDAKRKRKLFLELLKHLKIVAPTDCLHVGEHKDENNPCYFMPSVLPTCSYINDSKRILPEDEFGKQVFYKHSEECFVEPLLIEFTYGTIPRGFLCFLAVQILQQNTHWTYYKRENYNQFDNFITFRKHTYQYFAIIDRISYLELQVRIKGKDKSSSNVYFEIQNAVTSALKNICDDFNSQFTDLRYGFLCKKCPGAPVHLALLSKDKPFPEDISQDHSAQCECQGTKLEDEHKIWLKVTS